jgi:DNA-binding MarR family transcriptional regulator
MTLDSHSFQGLASFRYALRRFLAASEAISRAAGVTQQQYQALLAIKTWSEPAMTMKDLAEQLLLTHHAAVQLVNRLARGGLAERAASPEDGRSVLLRLTADGDVLVDRLASEHLKEMQRQEPLLTRSLRRLRRIEPEASDPGEPTEGRG